MANTTEKNRPVEKIRAYPVTASIWKNETDKGVFYSVTVSRTYKDDQDKFHDTDSFSGADLLKLSHVSAKAYDRVEKLTRAARIAAKEDDQPDEEYDQDTGEVTGAGE